MQQMFRLSLLLFSVAFFNGMVQAQPVTLWHGKERSVRYRPEREDFVIVNGTRRFNRALYGSNTAFRAEAGDLPEFALYLPGMGGNLKFGFILNDSSRWLIKAAYIKARYRPGSMLYEIRDPLLQGGTLTLTALPTFNGEALLVRAELKGTPFPVQLFCAFGGASGTNFPAMVILEPTRNHRFT